MKPLLTITAATFCFVIIVGLMVFSGYMFSKSTDFRIVAMRAELKNEVMEEKIIRFREGASYDSAQIYKLRNENKELQTFKTSLDTDRQVMLEKVKALENMDLPKEDITIIVMFPNIGPIPIPMKKGSLNKKNENKIWWNMKEWEKMAEEYKSENNNQLVEPPTDPGNSFEDKNNKEEESLLLYVGNYNIHEIESLFR